MKSWAAFAVEPLNAMTEPITIAEPQGVNKITRPNKTRQTAIKRMEKCRVCIIRHFLNQIQKRLFNFKKIEFSSALLRLQSSVVSQISAVLLRLLRNFCALCVPAVHFHPQPTSPLYPANTTKSEDLSRQPLQSFAVFGRGVLDDGIGQARCGGGFAPRFAVDVRGF
jgi:hypothetical protein